MIPNASLFIPNWQIHHELNLLATSKFICRQSSVLFILTRTTPSRSRLFGNPFQIPEKSSSLTFVLLFFSHFIIFFHLYQHAVAITAQGKFPTSPYKLDLFTHS